MMNRNKNMEPPQSVNLRRFQRLFVQYQIEYYKIVGIQ